jgi:small conductance mechanosensitive channel
MSFFDSLEQYRIGSLSLATILYAVVVLIICLLARKIINNILTNVINKSMLDKGLKSFLSSAVNTVIWIVIILITADNLNIPITSLVAVLSVAGLAFSLSLQSLLANLFSGLTILATKPFNVGDLVEVNDTTGTIKTIGLFYTIVSTADGRTVYIPNNTVTAAKVTNYSTNPNRRIDLEIAVSYDDSPEKVKEAINDAIASIPEILSDPAPFVGVAEYGNSSIKYSILVWAERANFLSAKFALNEKLFEAFSKNGVTMTYDHLNVHLIDRK